MALSKIKARWAVIATAIFVIVGGAFTHYRLLGIRANELSGVDDEIRRTADANAAAERAVSDLPELREAVRRFALQVPPDADLSALLESVGSEQSGNGAPEREIVTKPTIAGKPVSRIPFSLQYRGSFHGTVTLLNRLQGGDLFARVERIVLERGVTTPATADGSKPLRVQVDFSTFARNSKELEAWAQAE